MKTPTNLDHPLAPDPAPAPAPRRALIAPSNPARVLTARATRAASAAVKAAGTTRNALARVHGLATPTVQGWFMRQTLNLRTLGHLGELVGLEPAALLLSDEDRAMIEAVADLLDEAGHHGRAEALNTFLFGRGA